MTTDSMIQPLWPVKTPELPASSLREPRHLGFDEHVFIDSHRARGVCVRQRAYLFAELGRRVLELSRGGTTEAAVARPSPDRYIAQLGPVALSVAWLRGRFDSVPDGQLLAIVWRGSVAKQQIQRPEHKHAAPVSTAAVLWEDVVNVSASSEESWRWCPVADAGAALTSDELADRYVEQLRAAYADVLAAA